ncbi:MAG: L-threonylcarbamoyladenylate synthase [Candidatus Kerfeldbacteria bacterium]|nr:L-threonylcarbamoyladenylate synthase [Candidatus Kerfeldbacteria bacterium]
MNIREAAAIIRNGGVVVYPTESFYALGANATNAQAVSKIFSLKRRDQKPIALVAGNWQQVERFFMMNKAEQSLGHRYWPGALTVLLKPKRKIAADALLGTTPPRSRSASGHPFLERRGHIGVGVRVPAHAQARTLALAVGVPITATSANLSGRPPTKSAAKVRGDFPGILIVPGRCGRQRLPSTVASIQAGRVRTVRPGAVILTS